MTRQWPFVFKPCLLILAAWLFLINLSCEPLVTQFKPIEAGIQYQAQHPFTPAPARDTLRVMTWNIRFAIGRTPWFGDSCGKRVIISEAEVLAILKGLAEKINTLQPDILLLQEVDVQSKRSAYIDQVQWLLDHTYFNYAAYASMWQAQYVPSDGLGRVNTGQAVLSRWKITAAERIQLALRSDQDALTKYFYLQRCILKTQIALPNVANFYVLNIHTDAFSTDNTRKKQLERFKAELDQLANAGAFFIAGGDLNSLPPGSDSTDFCDEDRCPGESFHHPSDQPQHKEGSNFTPEITWLRDLYTTYQPETPLETYLKDQSRYFTHTPDWNGFWNRKLDYLFTNYRWIPGAAVTHQEILDLSDHVPVSAQWEAPR
ncbi:endonuclease/exonuclease/phosphatase family protein [candidate division KSB1 bacterium]|nr:endonuclease/exonuclease/phosphatase family protein [candidate division KSB1 bacterium]